MKPDKRIIVIKYIRLFFLYILSSAVDVLVLYLLNEYNDNKDVSLLVIVLLIMFNTLILLFTIVMPVLFYRNCEYKITNDRIEIISGVYFLSKEVIPVKRIQHVEVIQGPFQRMFKVCSLRLFTAGSVLLLPCLGKETGDNVANDIKKLVEVKIDEEKSTE